MLQTLEDRTGLGNWVAAFHVGDLDYAPDSWLPALGVAQAWFLGLLGAVYQWMGVFFLCPFLFSSLHLPLHLK